MRLVPVTRLPIRLAAFLKLIGVAATGGEANLLVQEGIVAVNGQPETRRGRQLQADDRVVIHGLGAWQVAGGPSAKDQKHVD